MCANTVARRFDTEPVFGSQLQNVLVMTMVRTDLRVVVRDSASAAGPRARWVRLRSFLCAQLACAYDNHEHAHTTCTNTYKPHVKNDFPPKKIYDRMHARTTPPRTCILLHCQHTDTNNRQTKVPSNTQTQNTEPLTKTQNV
jgi:hypothetical protein